MSIGEDVNKAPVVQFGTSMDLRRKVHTMQYFDTLALEEDANTMAHVQYMNTMSLAHDVNTTPLSLTVNPLPLRQVLDSMLLDNTEIENDADLFEGQQISIANFDWANSLDLVAGSTALATSSLEFTLVGTKSLNLILIFVEIHYLYSIRFRL